MTIYNTLNSVRKFLKDNIVGAVVFGSLVFWVPISCLVSYVDRKRAEKEDEDWEWKRTDELIHPSDQREVIHIRVPRRNQQPQQQPQDFAQQQMMGRLRSNAGQSAL